MQTLLIRLIPYLYRQSGRVLPSRPSRGPLANLTPVRFALLVGSGYCAGQLLLHHVISPSWGEGDSMVPTLPVERTMMICSQLHRHGKDVKLGDIVYAKNPVIPNARVGKRVVGLPGDYVLKDEGLAPTAGGARMPGFGTGTGMKAQREGDGERKEPVMVQVPEGHVWLAGDNMGRSRDSRFYGPVPLALIEGKIVGFVEGWVNFTWFQKDYVKKVERAEGYETDVD